MRKYAFITIVFAAALIIIGEVAHADICVLKTGDYSGATPCTTADSADGTTDDIVNLEFYAGSDIEIDIVYQQEGTKYRMELFNTLLYYDTANMTDTSVADPNTPKDYVSCTVDPSGYFKDSMGAQISKAVCDYDSFGYAVDTDGNKVVAEYEMNFTGDTFPAAGSEPDTFIMDQIVFLNESYVKDDTYEYFDFATTGGSPTDVGAIFSDNTRCPLINLGLQCDSNGITTAQTLMKTKITIAQTPCYVGTPTVATPTCKGQTGCTVDSGNADFAFTYTLPTTCYGDATCSTTSTECSYGVRISDGTTNYDESDGTYTETKSVGDTVSGYTVIGIDSNSKCLPSSSLNCSGTEAGSVSVASVSCKCGDPPIPALTDSGMYGEDGTGKWFNKRDIEIDFTVDDPDADDGSGLPNSVPTIKLYFTNDMGTTTYSYDVNSNTKTALDSSGVFSAIIDGDTYVRNDVPIYFGVIATDEDGLSGEYPAGFTCTSDTSCDWTDSTKYVLIPGDHIIKATSFEFTEQPFPNQFPFRASTNSLLKVFFEMSDEAEVTMRIYSMDGQLIRQIESSNSEVQSTTSTNKDDCSGDSCNFCNYASGCQWDGTNYRGGTNLVTNGMYIVNIHAICTGTTFKGSSIDYTKAIVVMK